MKFLEIAPLVHLPRRAGESFTYSNKKNIAIGTLVIIPFRNRKVRGVVISSIKKIPLYPLKEVISCVTDEVYFSKVELQFIKKIAEYYLAPLPEILKLFIPDRIPLKTIRMMHRNLKKTNRLKNNATTSIHFASSIKYDIESVSSEIKKVIINKGQILFLTPTLPQLYELEKVLQQTYKDTLRTVLHSQLNASQIAYAMLSIVSKKPQFILALRHGLFAPFVNLSLIIVLDALNDSYKQWGLHPKYHTQQLLEIRQNIIPTPLHIFIPYLTTKYTNDISLKRATLLGVPQWNKFNSAIFLERKSDPFSFNPLNSSIQALYTRTAGQKRWLFFLNRKGIHRFIVCKDCGWEARCPVCILILTQKHEQILSCNRCDYSGPLPLVCPTCNGAYLKQFGVGVDALKKYILSITSIENPNILEKDSDTSITSHTIIATDKLFSLPPIKSFDFVVIVNADAERSTTHWNAEDMFIQKVWKLLLYKKDSGTFYIQSTHPEDIAKLFSKQSATKQEKKRIEIQKSLFYPPYGEILVLTKKLNSNETIEQPKELQVYLKTIKKCSYSAQLFTSKRGRYQTITIRIPLPNISIKRRLYDIVPKDWQIESNPL